MFLPIEAIIWDLDNTLYRFDKMFEEACNRAAAKTICALVGGDLDEEEIFQVAERSYAQHGYSGKALIAHYGLEYRDYHFPFHETIDEKILHRNDDMIDALRDVSVPQAIVTNASRHWAQRALDHLGLREFFPDHLIVPIEDTDFEAKAYSRRPFELACERMGAAYNTRVLVAEDMAPNLKIPKEMGMQTALIHHGRVPLTQHDYIDAEFPDTLALLKAIAA